MTIKLIVIHFSLAFLIKAEDEYEVLKSKVIDHEINIHYKPEVFFELESDEKSMKETIEKKIEALTTPDSTTQKITEAAVIADEMERKAEMEKIKNKIKDAEGIADEMEKKGLVSCITHTGEWTAMKHMPFNSSTV